MGRPVFRFEDTEGEDIERSEVEPPELPRLYEVAERFGVKVRYQGHHGSEFGYYAPDRKEIVLMTHQNSLFGYYQLN